jgi:hypothetical protein
MAGNKKKKGRARKFDPKEKVLRRIVTNAYAREQKAEAEESARIERLNNTKLGDPEIADRLDATFKPMIDWLNQVVITGEREELSNGVAILRTPSHSTGREWFDLCEAFNNVADTFELIAESQNIKDEGIGLRQVANKVKVDMLLFQSDIDLALKSIQWMRDLAAGYTPEEITKFTKIIETREHFKKMGMAA